MASIKHILWKSLSIQLSLSNMRWIRNGLKETELKFNKNVLLSLIRYYTREAGVRGLERQIAKILRKVVKERLIEKKATTTQPTSISSKNIEKYSGVKKFKYGVAEKDNAIGQVTGLAWTEVGGELLTIEASNIDGKGQVIKTGSLGDVMQESIQAALTVVRSRAESLGISPNFYEKYDDIFMFLKEQHQKTDQVPVGLWQFLWYQSSLVFL